MVSAHKKHISLRYLNQSVTSRLETSRYRDFSQFFESIGIGLENFCLEKKSRFRSRKYLVLKKSLGIGLENFGLKKSLDIGLENIGLKKSLSNDLKKIVLENFGLQKLWTW